MKEKKGFTLVELLAVIAILAILVIMALPAVLNMYNKARIDSFSNEVNTIVRTAKQQYLLDGATEQEYTSVDVYDNKLNLTGNSKLQYYVHVDKNGKIVEVQVTNGDLQYSMSGDIDTIDSESVDTVSELEGNDVLVVDGNSNYKIYKYSFTCEPNGPGRAYKSSPLNAPSSDWNYFIKTTMNGNIIDEVYLGFRVGDNIYYLKGGNDSKLYEKNKNILLNIFGESACTESSPYFRCNADGYFVRVKENGNVYASNGTLYCSVHGGFYCLRTDESPCL